MLRIGADERVVKIAQVRVVREQTRVPAERQLHPDQTVAQQPEQTLKRGRCNALLRPETSHVVHDQGNAVANEIGEVCSMIVRRAPQLRVPPELAHPRRELDQLVDANAAAIASAAVRSRHLDEAQSTHASVVHRLQIGVGDGSRRGADPAQIAASFTSRLMQRILQGAHRRAVERRLNEDAAHSANRVEHVRIS
jgi:hypothetical protein